MKCVECDKWEATIKHVDIFIEDGSNAKAIVAENICIYCLMEALDVKTVLELEKPINMR